MCLGESQRQIGERASVLRSNEQTSIQEETEEDAKKE
jgi:hypothetical protein